jgi:hypothetical protein
MRAESLQWRAPCSFEAFVAAGTIAGVPKKSLMDAPCDDPRAALSGVSRHLPPVAPVLDEQCFVSAASCGPSPTAATVAGFSIATTPSPSSGILRCSSAPSDAPAESSFRIPSINTPGFAVAVCSVALCLGVAFSGELTDLDWGSWEGRSRKAQVSEGIALLSEAP